jgi:hypothetical protein
MLESSTAHMSPIPAQRRRPSSGNQTRVKLISYQKSESNQTSDPIAVGQRQSVFHGRAVRRRHLESKGGGGNTSRFMKHSVPGLSCAAGREAPCEIITLSCRTSDPYTGVLRDVDLGSSSDGASVPVIPGHHDGQAGPMQGTSIPWAVARDQGVL